jgi:hypothetical protein
MTESDLTSFRINEGADLASWAQEDREQVGPLIDIPAAILKAAVFLTIAWALAAVIFK